MRALLLLLLLSALGVDLVNGLRLHRAAAAVTGAIVLGLSPPNVLPAAADVYVNTRYHTTFNYPSKWVYNTGALAGDRKVEAWVSPEDPLTSASLVITAIPADYTRLTSFGGKDTLREYLVPRGEGIGCTVVSEVIKGETYTLEYIVSSGAEPAKHVVTSFALRPAESVVGLTVQTPEADYAKNKVLLEGIVPSLKVDMP